MNCSLSLKDKGCIVLCCGKIFVLVLMMEVSLPMDFSGCKISCVLEWGKVKAPPGDLVLDGWLVLKHVACVCGVSRKSRLHGCSLSISVCMFGIMRKFELTVCVCVVVALTVDKKAITAVSEVYRKSVKRKREREKDKNWLQTVSSLPLHLYIFVKSAFGGGDMDWTLLPRHDNFFFSLGSWRYEGKYYRKKETLNRLH